MHYRYHPRSSRAYAAWGMRPSRAARTVEPMSSATRIRSALDYARRDEVVAAALAVLVGAASLLMEFTWLETLASAALCLPLAWRSRWPLRVLGILACGVLVNLALVRVSETYAPPVVFALYSVAVLGTRRRTLAVAAGMIAAAIAVGVLFSPGDDGTLQEIVQEVTRLGFALAVGEAVRGRRQFVGALRERAERAEREQELEARRQVDEERVRIARDVHDVVAHSIATISTQASVGLHIGREEPERAVEALAGIKEISARALYDLRSTLGVLREESGAPTGPAPSMQLVPELVEQARGTGLAIDLRMEGSPAGLPAALGAGIYRIVQEGLTNVMRHAEGADAIVHIAVGAEEVEVEVSDDGTGASTDAGAAGGQSGLIGMRERATALGGVFEAGRRADGGFSVRAVIPLDREDS